MDLSFGVIDHYGNRCDKLITLGDFGIEQKQAEQNFYENLSAKNLNKEPTCFKSDNHKCIDLILILRLHGAKIQDRDRDSSYVYTCIKRKKLTRIAIHSHMRVVHIYRT